MVRGVGRVEEWFVKFSIQECVGFVSDRFFRRRFKRMILALLCWRQRKDAQLRPIVDKVPVREDRVGLGEIERNQIDDALQVLLARVRGAALPWPRRGGK